MKNWETITSPLSLYQTDQDISHNLTPLCYFQIVNRFCLFEVKKTTTKKDTFFSRTFDRQVNSPFKKQFAILPRQKNARQTSKQPDSKRLSFVV